MNDLNLIPEQIKIEQENIKRKRRNILLSIVACLLITGITLLPVYLTYETASANALLLQEMSQLKFVSEEVDKLNSLKKEAQDRAKVLEELLKHERKWSVVIEDISKLTPSSIALSSINGDSGNISLQCTAKNWDDIALFMGKLETSGKFADVKINIISAADNSFVFDLILVPRNS